MRPACIVSAADVPEKAGRYPNRDEVFGHGRAIGRAAGMERIGLHVERLAPGQRTSLPHAEEREEEFVYVLAGTPSVWLDGVLHPLQAGDLVAFPSGTGIAHTLINDSDEDALLFVGGERNDANRIVYPLDPGRRAELPDHQWWDLPPHALGPHDGRPKPR